MHASACLTALLLAIAPAVHAFPTDVAAPVRVYIEANRRSDPELLARAFHPSALMYWLEKDGHVASRTQAEWRKQMSAATAPPRFEQKIAAVDRRGDAAVVTVAGTLDGQPITDLMLLMKLEGEWRIVGKVFTRASLPEQPDTQAAAAIRALVADKLRSDRSFSGAELMATQHPRAMFFNLDREQLVAVSAQEWAARFEHRRRNGSALRPLEQDIGPTVAIGDIGYARWTVSWSGGSRITDYALLLREGGRWYMLNTAYVADVRDPQ
jgi:hypothetical protein